MFSIAFPLKQDQDVMGEMAVVLAVIVGKGKETVTTILIAYQVNY